ARSDDGGRRKLSSITAGRTVAVARLQPSLAIDSSGRLSLVLIRRRRHAWMDLAPGSRHVLLYSCVNPDLSWRGSDLGVDARARVHDRSALSSARRSDGHSPRVEV